MDLTTPASALSLSDLTVRTVFLAAFLVSASLPRYRSYFHLWVVADLLAILAILGNYRAGSVASDEVLLGSISDLLSGLSVATVILAVYQILAVGPPLRLLAAGAVLPGAASVASAAFGQSASITDGLVHLAHVALFAAAVVALLRHGYRNAGYLSTVGIAAAFTLYMLISGAIAAASLLGASHLLQSELLLFGDLTCAVFLQVGGLALPMEQVNREARRAATTDRLTGLMNRTGFAEAARALIVSSRRSGDTLWVMVFDLDHFKRVNDEHGHQAGDLVLAEAAGRLRKAFRARTDLVARWGGEEFVAMVVGSETEQVTLAAHRARKSIADGAFQIADGVALQITTSVGAAPLAHGEALPDPAVARADRLLYEAKAQGRNRLRIEAMHAREAA